MRCSCDWTTHCFNAVSKHVDAANYKKYNNTKADDCIFAQYMTASFI